MPVADRHADGGVASLIMKIAYVILAHKNPQQVSRLIEALTWDEEQFFIHVNKSSSQEPFLDSLRLLRHKSISIIRKNVALYSPPHFGLVTAFLNSLAEVLSHSSRFDYLILLSGQDYPIQPNDKIRSYPAETEGASF